MGMLHHMTQPTRGRKLLLKQGQRSLEPPTTLLTCPRRVLRLDLSHRTTKNRRSRDRTNRWRPHRSRKSNTCIRTISNEQLKSRGSFTAGAHETRIRVQFVVRAHMRTHAKGESVGTFWPTLIRRWFLAMARLLSWGGGFKESDRVSQTSQGCKIATASERKAIGRPVVTRVPSRSSSFHVTPHCSMVSTCAYSSTAQSVHPHLPL